MHEILECLCLFMLIMIDVKLTSSGLSCTAYLFVWMGRRCAGVIVGCLDSGSYLRYRFLWSLRVGSDLGCLSLWLFLIVYTGFMLLRFCPYVGSWRFLRWCILILWHVYFGDVWLISAATVEESYICMLFEFWCEDVASISWINALFACFIALIEIRRYKQPLRQENFKRKKKKKA